MWALAMVAAMMYPDINGTLERLRTMTTEKIVVDVTWDASRGYVGSAPGLLQPVIALSLSGLRRKIEALISPDEVIVTLNLDKAARLERDRRRLTGRARPGFAGTSA